MKINSDKCHLWAKTGNDKIWETKTVRVLGVAIDSELKFDEHLLNIYLKANRKLSALLRIRRFLNFNKNRHTLSSMIFSVNPSI